MRQVIERLPPTVPKVCGLLEDTEEDLRASIRCLGHLSQRHLDHPPGRSALDEQNDEWLVCRRYLSAESMALHDATQDQDDHPHDKDEEEVVKLSVV